MRQNYGLKNGLCEPRPSFLCPKRKITVEVSEVGQGVGFWVARTLVDCREWPVWSDNARSELLGTRLRAKEVEKRYPVTG